MRAFVTSLCLAAGLIFAVAIETQTAQAQTSVTATCKDGTAFSGKSRSGACRGHGGVKAWDSATSGAAPAAAAAAPAAPVAAAPAAAPASMPASIPTAPTTPKAKSAKSAPMPSATAAPGGGPGMVWVSAGSKAYHCQGDKWYGTTKKGGYMTEADAKAKGLHGMHGKTCS